MLFSSTNHNIFHKYTENFMDNDQIFQTENSANDISSHVYGTPSVEELKMRVLARKLENRKKEKRKKLK
jgi:hypothetical protein